MWRYNMKPLNKTLCGLALIAELYSCGNKSEPKSITAYHGTGVWRNYKITLETTSQELTMTLQDTSQLSELSGTIRATFPLDWFAGYSTTSGMFKHVSADFGYSNPLSSYANADSLRKAIIDNRKLLDNRVAVCDDTPLI